MTNIIFLGHLQAFPSAAQKSNFFSFFQKLLKCQNFSAIFRFSNCSSIWSYVLRLKFWVRTSIVAGLTMTCDDPGSCWSITSAYAKRTQSKVISIYMVQSCIYWICQIPMASLCNDCTRHKFQALRKTWTHLPSNRMNYDWSWVI